MSSVGALGGPSGSFYLVLSTRVWAGMILSSLSRIKVKSAPVGPAIMLTIMILAASHAYSMLDNQPPRALQCNVTAHTIAALELTY